MKYIGETTDTLTNGQEYGVNIQPMTSKIYKDGEYVKDERLMVWIDESFRSTAFYECLNQAELDKLFK